MDLILSYSSRMTVLVDIGEGWKNHALSNKYCSNIFLNETLVIIDYVLINSIPFFETCMLF